VGTDGRYAILISGRLLGVAEIRALDAVIRASQKLRGIIEVTLFTALQSAHDQIPCWICFPVNPNRNCASDSSSKTLHRPVRRPSRGRDFCAIFVRASQLISNSSSGTHDIISCHLPVQCHPRPAKLGGSLAFIPVGCGQRPHQAFALVSRDGFQLYRTTPKLWGKIC